MKFGGFPPCHALRVLRREAAQVICPRLVAASEEEVVEPWRVLRLMHPAAIIAGDHGNRTRTADHGKDQCESEGNDFHNAVSRLVLQLRVTWKALCIFSCWAWRRNFSEFI